MDIIGVSEVLFHVCSSVSPKQLPPLFLCPTAQDCLVERLTTVYHTGRKYKDRSPLSPVVERLITLYQYEQNTAVHPYPLS